MLETVREFAGERLAAGGESDLLHQRLTDWGLTLFGPAFSTYFATRDRAILARVIPELDNLRAAVQWGIGRYAPARHLAVHLGWHYTIRSLLREAVTLAERVHEAAADDPPQARANVLLLLGFVAFAQLKYELGMQYAARGETVLASAGLPMSGEFPLLRWMLSFINGTFVEKEELLDQAFELFEPSPRDIAMMYAHGYLADVLYRTGIPESAEPMATETLALARAQRDDWCVSMTRFTLARIAADRGDVAGALDGFVESARLGWSVLDLRQAAWCIWASAILLVRQQLPVPAVTLLGVATRLHELRGGLSFDDGPASAGRTLAELQAVLPADVFAAALKTGLAMSTEQAIEYVATLRLPAPASAPAVAAPAPYGLTARELEILRLLVDDRSSREMADQLFISPRTVTTHITHIFNKLGVNSRAAAVALALRQSLV
jgi:DNA-binding CsgD family transcriptional regulator